MPAAWRVQMKTSNAIARFFICFALVLIAIMFFVSNATGTAVPKSYRLIHTFTGGSDGSLPTDIPVLDAAGNVYGTTTNGGTFGQGVVYKVSPNSDGSWSYRVLYNFGAAANDGINSYSGLIFDKAGNLYGDTCRGGTGNSGTVFELLPASDGRWTEKVLYSFTGGNDAQCPRSTLLLDRTEQHLYGTTSFGGDIGCGTAFQLERANDNWEQRVIHAFTGTDECFPSGGLTLVGRDTLFGMSSGGGTNNDNGTIFQIAVANGTWTESVLHNFTGLEGHSPLGSLTRVEDDLYGTATNTVFRMTFMGGHGSVSVLHRFGGELSNDGILPFAGVAVGWDASAKHVFGMTWRGGKFKDACSEGCGVAYEITF